MRPEWRRLVTVCYELLDLAIAEIPKKKWWSEVAMRMQHHAQTAGFSVVDQYVGHGIGRIMHENPQVPNFDNPRERRKYDF